MKAHCVRPPGSTHKEWLWMCEGGALVELHAGDVQAIEIRPGIFEVDESQVIATAEKLGARVWA